jgi:hypothetical protein
MKSFSTKRWSALALGLCALAVVTYLATGVTGRSQAGAIDATVSVTSTSAFTDSEATVDVVVTPEAGVTVGALLVLVTYDDALLNVTACSHPVCNPDYSTNQVALAFANFTGITGVVSTITFNTLSTPASANLDVALTTCADEQGVDLTCTTSDGTITITNPTPTPSPTPSPTPTLSPTASPTATPGVTHLWGDTNCDGTVNSVDALATLRWRAGLPVFQVQPCPIIGAGYP